MIDYGEPKCYDEAMQVENIKKWEQYVNEEMESLVRNQTWDLVKLLAEKRALQNKWVYKLRWRKEALQGQTCCKGVCTK